MKNIVAIFALAVASAVIAEEYSIISITASLKDGSTVRGELAEETIAGSTIFMEKLALDPAIVKSVNFAGTDGAAKVELLNGDKFAMTVANEAFAVKSLLGDLKIPRGSFRSLALARRKVAAGGAEEGLVFFCTFDDEAAITSPAVGPAGTVCSREFTDGKINRAVRVPVGGSAGVFTLPPETFGKEGCIEFWARIEPRRDYFRDCDPRIIFMKSPAGCFTVEYSANNGEGGGGFFVRCFNFSYLKGGSFSGSYKFSDYISDISDWHHYAFSWVEDALAIYIDGKKLLGAHKTSNGKIDGAKLNSASFIMGLPNDNTKPNNTEPNTPFTIDELKIWNYPKSEFDL